MRIINDEFGLLHICRRFRVVPFRHASRVKWFTSLQSMVDAVRTRTMPISNLTNHIVRLCERRGNVGRLDGRRRRGEFSIGCIHGVDGWCRNSTFTPTDQNTDETFAASSSRFYSANHSLRCSLCAAECVVGNEIHRSVAEEQSRPEFA